MIYLRKFDNHAAYEAAESSLILPNVSLCVQENEVHYNPSTPPAPSHDYVEIGGVKWATMNVGANSITDTGLYFQWGDTQGYTAAQVGDGEGQKYFGEEDYKYYDSENYNFTKYNDEDELTTLHPSDDAVNAAWGGNWRMPTTAEFQTLGTATTSAWTADYEGSGVAGIVLTSNADSSKKLFFPACGDAVNGSVYNVGSSGFYWSSSLYSSDVSNAYDLDFSNSFVVWDSNNGRYLGFSVRGVLAN